MTCHTTHYACDCVLERMKKLEKVVEAAKGLLELHYIDYTCKNCAEDKSHYEKLYEALKELEA